MKNHIRYALSRYSNWFSWLATIIGLIAIFPLNRLWAILIVVTCVTLAFIIPFVISIIKRDFSIKTVGNSKVTVHFGDIFEEECFVITTNRYFDVDSSEEHISEASLLGLFVDKFYHNNIAELKNVIREKITIDAEGHIKPVPYGKTVFFQKDEKIIYLMAFTDRKKSAQPKDFYLKAVKGLLKELSEANHGKTIAIPLLGENNNLSNTGFSNCEVAFESLVSMINSFGIANPQAELRLKIVILPNKKTELIKVISNYA